MERLRRHICLATVLVFVALPATAQADVTLPSGSNWNVKATVLSKDAFNQLGFGLSDPTRNSVCTDCGPGNTGTFGTLAGGATLTTYLDDVYCHESFLSMNVYHAQITQLGPLSWKIGWDDSGGPCGDPDTDFNDLVVRLDAGYDFNGFHAPVDNAPLVNSAKAGSAIPVKFGLGGSMGLDVFADGYPSSRGVTCDSGATITPVEETVTASASGLSYDAANDEYDYVWKTNKAWAGTCRALTLKLKDETTRSATFRFK
jgi:hypothetical protein